MGNALKRIFAEFHGKKIEVIERKTRLPKITDKIHTIIGPRRAGKTCFLYQIIAGLEKSGVTRDKILFLNFEDERLKFTENDNYDVIFETFLELFPQTRPDEMHLFFDEIQVLPNWEKFVRRVFDGFSRNIYITGSNSAMLSHEIASSLRGRNYTTTILPLSNPLVPKNSSSSTKPMFQGYGTRGSSASSTGFWRGDPGRHALHPSNVPRLIYSRPEWPKPIA